MAPSSSQKGTGKKGGASAIRQQQQQQQQQRSRNTTPGPAAPIAIASLPPFETVETDTIELRFDVFRNLAFEDMVDPPASGTLIPDSKNLDGILTRLQRLGDVIEKRGLCCDRGMRLLAQSRKQRMDELALERGREEERRQREADGEERERKSNKKKRKGADTLAPHGGKIGQSCLSSTVYFSASSACLAPQSGKPPRYSWANRGGQFDQKSRLAGCWYCAIPTMPTMPPMLPMPPIPTTLTRTSRIRPRNTTTSPTHH